MKKRKNKMIFIVILIVIILIFYILQKNNLFQDDLIFLKFFNSVNINKNIEKTNMIESNSNRFRYNDKVFFFVTYEKNEFKSINLLETLDRKTLVKEKVAPGTEGGFEIVLVSNKNIKYKVIFENINEKPKNLIFSIEGREEEYSDLNELQTDLKGNLEKNKVERIDIHWKWKYETNLENDIQDTKDGNNIDRYEFNIYTIGY